VRDHGRDAKRILSAAKLAGIKQIDYLLSLIVTTSGARRK
jgi:hypothetical protein